jgi:hypothetical protein
MNLHALHTHIYEYRCDERLKTSICTQQPRLPRSPHRSFIGGRRATGPGKSDALLTGFGFGAGDEAEETLAQVCVGI